MFATIITPIVNVNYIGQTSRSLQSSIILYKSDFLSMSKLILLVYLDFEYIIIFLERKNSLIKKSKYRAIMLNLTPTKKLRRREFEFRYAHILQFRKIIKSNNESTVPS